MRSSLTCLKKLLIQNTFFFFTKYNWSLQYNDCKSCSVKYMETVQFTALCHVLPLHHHLCCYPQSSKAEYCQKNNKEAWRGFRSELLQEAEHQVSQCGAQRLVVVTDDVRPVLLQLNQRVLGLQVEDVSVCRLLHLHLCDAVLQEEERNALSRSYRCVSLHVIQAWMQKEGDSLYLGHR